MYLRRRREFEGEREGGLGVEEMGRLSLEEEGEEGWRRERISEDDSKSRKEVVSLED